MKDKCGIIGIHSKDASKDVSHLIYYGLYALQHRGQESAGIATHNINYGLNYHCGMGLVTDVFNNALIKSLAGNVGIGHVRYSTTGESKLESSQPFYTELDDGFIAIAHNGDIVNSGYLRKDLNKKGYEFRSDTDSEVVCYLIKEEAKNETDILKVIDSVSQKLIGSYSLVILINDELYVLRDPMAMKPLVLGQTDNHFVVASESVAFDVMNAQFIRDLEPGELIFFKDNRINSYILPSAKDSKLAHCMFEYVYFARPDSVIDKQSVYNARLRIGEALFKEFPIDADLVLPVPDSSIPAAIGYARSSGIPYGEGLIKNRYVGRTFIMPTQAEREIAVKLKVNPLKHELKGKTVVVIDDSIVRGTTSESLVKILKAAGVKEVHMLIGCPPVRAPCFYGVAMATKDELIAANMEIEDIRKHLGAETLGYISIESLIEAIGIEGEKLCLGCLNEEYPTEIPEDLEAESYYDYYKSLTDAAQEDD
ncbi:amidophosphoribosyltransferase [Methanobrevibacter olleyae]|uniref:Amidophosphoribosyltransferase n=1 Tax=Methanobrevibacter olleyae TaxID=294671 RepID=A0A126R1K5_METOL|nr:amidophosphoribosyltransferase [Methanobrevibacter olleyae]AMK15525.1 amidophosphoribosyltransferase PurF [Methanobrevibacter olleyae]SFL37198.1 amidophosphoribosyltransferase [Methanobrevibacter olleyae]